MIPSREQILATIDEHADELRSLGAKSLALLDKILGRKVDLVLADAVQPRLRSAILGEAVHASRP